MLLATFLVPKCDWQHFNVRECSRILWSNFQALVTLFSYPALLDSIGSGSFALCSSLHPFPGLFFSFFLLVVPFGSFVLIPSSWIYLPFFLDLPSFLRGSTFPSSWIYHSFFLDLPSSLPPFFLDLPSFLLPSF